MHHLIAFISSTADLISERNAVEEALQELNIDGSRFESWPSMPNNPTSECLAHIEESDAFILLLGGRYGSLHEKSGISITHLEFNYAVKLKRPIFVYLLKANGRELDQIKFIESIKATFFHCKEIENNEQLITEVKHSFLSEFTRCFRRTYSTPPEKLPTQIDHTTIKPEINLPDQPEEAYKFMERLYNSGNDTWIQQNAKLCESKFSNYPSIINFTFLSEVNLAMAGFQYSSDRLVKAIEFWESDIANQHWTKASLLYNQGNAFSALKRHRKAIERYLASLSLEPDDAQCLKNIGDSYRDMGEMSTARQYYEKAMQTSPLLFEALFSYATLLIQHEDEPETAVTYLKKISISSIKREQFGALHGWLATAYLKLDRYSEGIVSAQIAIAYAPDAKWAWLTAGRLFALARREDATWLLSAAEFWKKFATKYPESADAWAELGFVYWSLKEIDNSEQLSVSAFESFAKAMTLGYEDDGLVWDRIGHLHQDAGRWTDAEDAYRRAAQMDPKQFGYCHGVSLIALNKYEEALPLVLAAAQHHQPDALSWSQVAFCYLNLNQIDAAIAAYNKAIELDPNDPIAWFELGGIYWNKKDVVNAELIWRDAINRFPKHDLCKKAKYLIENQG